MTVIIFSLNSVSYFTFFACKSKKVSRFGKPFSPLFSLEQGLDIRDDIHHISEEIVRLCDEFCFIL